MPELPELNAATQQLRDRLVGSYLQRVDVAAVSVLKTADPPHSSLVGRRIDDIQRRGKFLLLGLEGRFVIAHLALAGWLRWQLPARAAAPKPSGPVAIRLVAGGEAENNAEPIALELTEQGRRKSLAVWITDHPDQLDRVARLGPEAESLTEEQFAEMLKATNARLKTVLTDQSVMAGIGNAWSDEILHRARLSPFAVAARLKPEETTRLHGALREVLLQAAAAMDGAALDQIKARKKSLFAVHDRTGQSCPVCAGTIAEVAYVDRSLQYCPTCQTQGKRLSDRRMDRLLK